MPKTDSDGTANESGQEDSIERRFLEEPARVNIDCVTITHAALAANCFHGKESFRPPAQWCYALAIEEARCDSSSQKRDLRAHRHRTIPDLPPEGLYHRVDLVHSLQR
jgi:hypothetical protein